MFLLHLLSPAGAVRQELIDCLDLEGISYLHNGQTGALEDLSTGRKTDAVLIDITSGDQVALERMLAHSRDLDSPTILVLSPEHYRDLELSNASEALIFYPWHVGELTLRIRQLLSRNRGPLDAPGIIRNGDLVINTQQYDVFLAGRTVLLTFKEYELLKLLASNPGRVFSREQLLEQVWGYQYFGGTRTVDVHVRRLRSKIEDAAHTFIDTIWNVGYRFVINKA